MSRIKDFFRMTWKVDIIIAVLTLPLYAAGIGRYGLRLLLLLVCSIGIGLFLEFGYFRFIKQKIDLVGLSTWFIVPLILPPAFPIWMVLAALIFGILIATVFFGGHGRELASPVAVAWAFAALSFARDFGLGWSLPFTSNFEGFNHFGASLLTIDHPLLLLKSRAPIPLMEILSGNFPQTPINAVPLLLIGIGLLLLLLRAIDFRSSLGFICTVVILTIGYGFFNNNLSLAVNSLFVGNLFAAAFFVIPVFNVTPRTNPGRWITAILTGVVAFLIRTFSSFPDGVFFAVLFGNSFSALIDDRILHYRYGRKTA